MDSAVTDVDGGAVASRVRVSRCEEIIVCLHVNRLNRIPYRPVG